LRGAVKNKIQTANKFEAIFFDFGGVIAEEGFRDGLLGIAINEGLQPEMFFESAVKAIYESGYIIGRASERNYWKMLREMTGVLMPEAEMKSRILNGFILRSEMIKMVTVMREKGLFVSLLSDQTNWLDELDAKSHFCRFFDAVFNSYHIGKSKRDPSVFSDVASILGISAEKCLFIDDNHGNVVRASEAGYGSILFRDVKPLAEILCGMDLVSPSDLNDILETSASC
jgi:putative hydrolase of the HAD superfamily